jgi:hypothetical protein
MEVIKIKTHGQFKLTAYKEKMQFIILSELLEAMQVEFIEDVLKFIKTDINWGSSIHTMELPGVGKKEVIQITRVMGLIYWLPESIVSFLPRWEVFTMLVVHLETYMEFFQWKMEQIEEQVQNYQDAVELQEKCSEDVINQQALLIEKLKQL